MTQPLSDCNLFVWDDFFILYVYMYDVGRLKFSVPLLWCKCVSSRLLCGYFIYSNEKFPATFPCMSWCLCKISLICAIKVILIDLFTCVQLIYGYYACKITEYDYESRWGIVVDWHNYAVTHHRSLWRFPLL